VKACNKTFTIDYVGPTRYWNRWLFSMGTCALRPVYAEKEPGVARHNPLLVLLHLGVAVLRRLWHRITWCNKTKNYARQVLAKVRNLFFCSQIVKL